uniref:Ig-like domain-containing protein n=1 Tax=Poecilia latipinna TaxID=48699 RepID=A0A3B3V3C1_9TELE
MAVKFVLSFLILMALQAAAEDVTYFEIGGTLTLNPMFSEAITMLTWKHKANIVAEYIKDSVPLEYLGDLKGRTNVNLTTGVLTVKDMRKSDDGQFTVEINNRVLPVSFNAVGIEKLPPVEVIVRPLTCNSDALSCTVSCGTNFTGVGPVQYFWKKGETEMWKEDEKTITIKNEEGKDRGFTTFTCKAKNLIGEKESSPAVNPFTGKKSDNTGAVAAGIVVPLAILSAAGGWFIYKKYIKKDESSAQAGQVDSEGQCRV